MKLKAPETFSRWRQKLAKRRIFTFIAHGIDANGNCDCGRAKCTAPGKHPRFSGADRGATIDPDRINEEARFSTANIGIHLGLSGLAVVDIDPRNGGWETLAKFETEHGSLYSSVIADTGGGGQHRFFLAPEDVKLPSSLGPGIDLLSGNKYPIIPPSRHHSGGQYRWQYDSDLVSAGFLLIPLPDYVVNFGLRTPDTAPLEPVEETEEEIARLKSALEYVSAECSRNDWRDIIFAFKSTGWQCAEEMAREWSMTAPHLWAEDAFDAIWMSAEADRPGGRTIASLYYAAKRNGWIDPTAPTRAETLGDIDNGRRFAQRYRGELIYDHSISKWRRYDNGIWRVCDTGEHIAAAKEMADAILKEAVERFTGNSTEANRAALSQAMRVHRSAPRIYAAIEMATAEPGMSVANSSAFDADPYLLGVEGGAIDLKSGKRLPPSHAHRISKSVGVRYDAKAKCPRFERLLSDILANREEVLFVQRFAGYTLSGSVDEEALLFMQGSGANGKSVLANILAGVMGDYFVTVGSELLAVTKNDSEANRFKAKLCGARMVLVNETGHNETFNDQRVKEIVSREAISARLLYGEAFHFMPTHTLWVRGNHRPAVLDSGDGMWRRLILLPFLRQFAADERIRDLDQQILKEEGSGILNWCIAGCLEWQKHGLKIPKSIQQETAQYRTDTDVIGDWMEQDCIMSPELRCGIESIYASYRAYYEHVGMAPKSQVAFVRMMRTRGYPRKPSNGKAYLVGIALNDI